MVLFSGLNGRPDNDLTRYPAGRITGLTLIHKRSLTNYKKFSYLVHEIKHKTFFVELFMTWDKNNHLNIFKELNIVNNRNDRQH